MAQYLSEATHQRLSQRHVEAYEDDAEVQIQQMFQNKMRSWTFDDQIRSMVVASRTTPTGQPLVWTGQQGEGDIALRNVRGDVCARIEKKRDVLVNALVSHENTLWAGLSDGCIRVFDQKTLQMVGEERKQHAGPITCLLSVGQTVFSGGADWQIYAWDPRTLRCIGQLSGHQNQVNCLCTEGDLIFSGGEDQAIRCWTWDHTARVGEERIDNWPKVGHAGGIRALVINEIFLFSAASDGGLKVWNTQNGQLVKYLDQRGEDTGGRMGGPQVRITCLERDPSAQRIWAGSTDGLIHVWDAQHLHLVGRLDMHCEAYVKDLLMVVRVSGMRVWSTNRNGFVKVWHSDTDEDADWSSNQGGEQQDRFEELRSTVIANYKELEKRKQELKLIEDIDIRRKGVLAESLGTRRVILMRRAYYAKLTRWVRWAREQANRKDMCERMMMSTSRGMRSVYYVKLRTYALEKKRQRRKEQFADMLMSGTNNGRRNLYWRHLQEFTHRWLQQQKRKEYSELLMQSTTKGTRHVCFLRWRRMARAKKMHKRKDNIAAGMLWNTKKGRIAIYWHRMVDFAQRERRRHKHLAIADSLAGNTARGTKVIFFKKLRRYAKMRKQRNKKYLVAETLMCTTKKGTQRYFYFRWRDWALQRARDKLHDEWDAAKIENDEVQAVLEQQACLSSEEIELELQRLEQQIADAMAEIEEENKRLRDQELVIQKLKREEKNVRIPLSDDMAQSAQMQRIVEWLKAPAVHFEWDFEELELHQGTGAARFCEGMAKARKQINLELRQRALKANAGSGKSEKEIIDDTDFAVEGQEWPVYGEIFENWSEKRLKAIARGIRASVVSFDVLDHQQKIEDIPSDVRKEFIHNSGTMLEIIMILMELRRKREQEKTGVSRRTRVTSRSKPKRESRRAKAVETPLPKDTSSKRSRRSSSRGRAEKPEEPPASPKERSRSRGTRPEKGSRKSKKQPLPEEKPWLGWTLLMEDLHTGMPPEKCLIVHIRAGSPAYLAEMKHNDVITMFGGEPITDIPSFKIAFKRHAKVGEMVTVRFERPEEGGTAMEYDAELEVQSFAHRDAIIREAKAAIAEGHAPETHSPSRSEREAPTEESPAAPAEGDA